MNETPASLSKLPSAHINSNGMVDFSPTILHRIGDLCARHGVATLELTGSAARENFDPQTSDFDFLVEFLPDAKMSALAFVEFFDSLEAILGRRVDLIELSAVRNPILREAFVVDRMPIYAAA